MRIKAWLKQAGEILEREEIEHLDVQKGKIQLQLKNPLTGKIELHEFEYVAKDAQNLKIERDK
jgi:hypothetical protein